VDAKTHGLVGRAGLKLEAALDHFALTAAVRGARAVDVGASTGGFTQVLLARGATSVVCVDAGHGQLHEVLRRDARVLNLERADWKRLSLSQAPGPFDFFTVDVSFVAARNMLRGLAFRLRTGSEGVVLVKPQFELPGHLVKGGDVRDPALRRQALARFMKKADGLGFRVVAHFDSPVAGGEGTIEILTHVRFEGRPEALPRPGERRPTTSTAPRPRRIAPPAREALAGALDWFLVAVPGTEDIAAREAAGLPGSPAVKAVAGGVELRGPLEVGMQANLLLRIPTRLLLRVCDVRAREFGKLRHQLARTNWESWLPAGAPLRISVSATHCRLYHTGAIEEAVRAAIGDRTGKMPDKASAQTPNAQLVLVRGVDDNWKVSVDSSGERLHRRGWRTESGTAPLRESLAAALLALAGWTPQEALFDPMCGAGTIPIEACTAALGIAPGLHRSFAFESWPGLPPTALPRWSDLRQQAASARRDTLTAAIVASDRNAQALAATRRNAARAGVESALRIIEQPLREAEPPAATGLFIANPPYGERLGSRRDLPAIYREIGDVLRRRFQGWRATIVVPDARLASAFRLRPVDARVLVHGGLRVTALRFAP
jgi:putative N6-adenine-specific DNA methylase